MSAAPHRIDVHQHILPPFYRDALAASGIADAGGRALPEWGPDAALELMDLLGTATGIVSVSTPGTGFLNDTSEASDLARRLNDYTAGIAADTTSTTIAACGAIEAPRRTVNARTAITARNGIATITVSTRMSTRAAGTAVTTVAPGPAIAARRTGHAAAAGAAIARGTSIALSAGPGTTAASRAAAPAVSTGAAVTARRTRGRVGIRGRVIARAARTALVGSPGDFTADCRNALPGLRRCGAAR